MDKTWRGVIFSVISPRHVFRHLSMARVLSLVSELHCVTRRLPFSLQTLASWHWCPSHDYIDRSLNLDAWPRFDSTARTTAQSALSFYPWGFYAPIFTHEVFFAYAESWIFNSGGKWHRPSNIWVPIGKYRVGHVLPTLVCDVVYPRKDIFLDPL